MVSGPTTKGVLEEGSRCAIDEACLATKIFLGHVKALIGKCDYILIPRISNFGLQRSMCTKFEALYDMTANTFRGTGQKFLSYNVDVRHKLDEEKAFADMGAALGFRRKEAEKAYKKAKKAEQDDWKSKVKEQEKLYQTPKTRILLAGHSYMIEDEYVGKGKRIVPPVVFQGGVSKNIGVVEAFRKALGYEIQVDENGHLMGALGAAILAAKSGKRKAFDFSMEDMEFRTREVRCGRCSNNCEIMCVYRNDVLIDSWGNRCEKGALTH